MNGYEGVSIAPGLFAESTAKRSSNCGDEKAKYSCCVFYRVDVPFSTALTRRHLVLAVGVRYHPRWSVRPTRAMDTLTRLERSKRMALIRSKGTKPELLVREIARSCGYKFRVNVSDLPGKPDLVFPRRRKVVFIHGCFWHRHQGCALARIPKSKLGFWLPKLTENHRRDLRNIARLRRHKWKVAVVWECQLSKLTTVRKRLRKFLEQTDAMR